MDNINKYTTIFYSQFKDVVFNEQNKIVILKPVTNNILKSIGNKLLDKIDTINWGYKKTQVFQRNIRNIQNIDDINILYKIYFEDLKDKKIDYPILQLFFYHLKEEEYLLLPFPVIMYEKRPYLNFQSHQTFKFNMFDNLFNKDIEIVKLGKILISLKTTASDKNRFKTWQKIYFSTNIKSLNQFEPEIAHMLKETNNKFNDNRRNNINNNINSFFHNYPRYTNKLEIKIHMLYQVEKKDVFK